MKAYCPECKQYVVLFRKKGGGQRSAARCPHCAGRVSWAAQTHDPASQGPPGPRPSDGEHAAPAGSVADMSPGYPKYRNALIIIVFALVVFGVLIGVHVASKAVQKAIRDFAKNPISHIMSTVMHSDRLEVCRAFVRQNERRFAALGGDLEVLPIRQAVKAVNGRKTATIVARITGTRGSGDVTFRLKKINSRWQVHEAALELKNGHHYKLYP